MGNNTTLGQIQATILNKIAHDDFFTDAFYFTGGTALSEIYLHHRISVDLDFFSFRTYDSQNILSRLQAWSQELSFSIETQFTEPVNIYLLTFTDKEVLKVDFAHYPYKQLREQTLYAEKLAVDSLFDIAVNKLLTITQRTELKDFADLYFLLQEFTFWDLRDGVKIKFNVDIEPFIMASDFMVVDDFEYMPNMLKPLDLSTLKRFFKEQARKLGGSVVEE